MEITIKDSVNVVKLSGSLIKGLEDNFNPNGLRTVRVRLAEVRGGAVVGYHALVAQEVLAESLSLYPVGASVVIEGTLKDGVVSVSHVAPLASVEGVTLTESVVVGDEDDDDLPEAASAKVYKKKEDEVTV